MLQMQASPMLTRPKPFASRQAASTAGRTRLICLAHTTGASTTGRRELLQSTVLFSAAALLSHPTAALAIPRSEGYGANTTTSKLLCDAECEKALDSKPMVTLESGLQYKDLIEGKGSNPPTGFQVVVNYVAITPGGRVFDSSLDKGAPYDIRVGAGQVIPGLDEGLLTMKPGGLRRLYIPGSLAFPKGLKAAAGRPAVPPSTPVIFDVQLLYVPGLEDE